MPVQPPVSPSCPRPVRATTPAFPDRAAAPPAGAGTSAPAPTEQRPPYGGLSSLRSTLAPTDAAAGSSSLRAPASGTSAVGPDRHAPASRSARAHPYGRHFQAAMEPPSRFRTLLERARAVQPAAEQPAWQAAVEELCSARTRAEAELPLWLLSKLLRVPAPLQAEVAHCTVYFSDACKPLKQRAPVLDTWVALVLQHGAQGLAEVRQAFAAVQQAAQRNVLFLAVGENVPMAHVPWFLRASECLLRPQHGESPSQFDRAIDCVRHAALLCQRPVRPRGATAQMSRLRLPQPAGSANASPGAAGPSREAAAQTDTPSAEDAAQLAADAAYAQSLYEEDVARGYFCGGEGPAAPVVEARMAPHAAHDEPFSLRRARPENVQDSNLIAALKHSWAHLNDKYPRILPTEALFHLASGALDQLCVRARMVGGYFQQNFLPKLERVSEPAFLSRSSQTLSGADILRYVWHGDGDNRMSAIARDMSMATTLGEQGIKTRDFVALVWLMVHADRRSLQVDADQAAKDRDNLRFGFWSAVADTANWWQGPDRQVVLGRWCANGFAQRLLKRLSGYEDIGMEEFTPNQLLSQVAQEFCRPYAEGGEPSAEELAYFLLFATAQARATFKGEAQRQQFEVNLRDFMVEEWQDKAAIAFGLAAERDLQDRVRQAQ